MNIHKKNAAKAFNDICNFLNYKSPSKIVVDNDLNKNHCESRSCSYLKENPLNKQPCTCNDRSLIRLVNINNNSNSTDFYRLYYQLGHELGHQYFDALEVDKDLSETLACHLSIIVVKKFLRNPESYLKRCIAVSTDYREYMEKAYKGVEKLNCTIDREMVKNYFKDAVK